MPEEVIKVNFDVESDIYDSDESEGFILLPKRKDQFDAIVPGRLISDFSCFGRNGLCVMDGYNTSDENLKKVKFWFVQDDTLLEYPDFIPSASHIWTGFQISSVNDAGDTLSGVCSRKSLDDGETEWQIRSWLRMNGVESPMLIGFHKKSLSKHYDSANFYGSDLFGGSSNLVFGVIMQTVFGNDRIRFVMKSSIGDILYWNFTTSLWGLDDSYFDLPGANIHFRIRVRSYYVEAVKKLEITIYDADMNILKQSFTDFSEIIEFTELYMNIGNFKSGLQGGANYWFGPCKDTYKTYEDEGIVPSTSSFPVFYSKAYDRQSAEHWEESEWASILTGNSNVYVQNQVSTSGVGSWEKSNSGTESSISPLKFSSANYTKTYARVRIRLYNSME